MNDAPADHATPDRPPIRMRWWLWISLALVLALVSGGIFIRQAFRARADLLALIEELEPLNRGELTHRWIVRNHGFFYRVKDWEQKVDWSPRPAAPRPARVRDGNAAPPVPWFPSADEAPRAIAVTPRADHLDFDSIFLFYEGEKVVISLALASVGGYFNRLPISRRDYPQTIIPRALTSAEITQLNQMLALLEQRRDSFDPQSDRYGWTQTVINLVQEILAAQPAPKTP